MKSKWLCKKHLNENYPTNVWWLLETEYLKCQVCDKITDCYKILENEEEKN